MNTPEIFEDMIVESSCSMNKLNKIGINAICNVAAFKDETAQYTLSYGVCSFFLSRSLI